MERIPTIRKQNLQQKDSNNSKVINFIDYKKLRAKIQNFIKPKTENCSLSYRLVLKYCLQRAITDSQISPALLVVTTIQYVGPFRLRPIRTKNLIFIPIIYPSHRNSSTTPSSNKTTRKKEVVSMPES